MPSPGNMKYDKYVTTKGQLISKVHFGFFKATKISKYYFFENFCPSLEKEVKSKKDQIR